MWPVIADLLPNRVRAALEQWGQGLINILAVQHKDDGTHGDVTADSAVVSGDLAAGGRFRLPGAAVSTIPQATNVLRDGLDDGPTYSVYKLEATADATVNSIYANDSSKIAGQNIWLLNNSTHKVTLAHAAVSGIGRIFCPNSTNVILLPNQSALLIFDGETRAWWVIGSTSGTIGGWTIGATTITGGNVTLDSSGVITLGTGNDVVVLSAADSTYRMWVGHANASSAPFSVKKDGTVTVGSASVFGSFDMTQGINFHRPSGLSYTNDIYAFYQYEPNAGTGQQALVIQNDVSGGSSADVIAAVLLKTQSYKQSFGAGAGNFGGIALISHVNDTFTNLLSHCQIAADRVQIGDHASWIANIGNYTDAGYRLYVDGTLGVTGAVTFTSTLNVTGLLTLSNHVLIDSAAQNYVQFNSSGTPAGYIGVSSTLIGAGSATLGLNAVADLEVSPNGGSSITFKVKSSDGHTYTNDGAVYSLSDARTKERVGDFKRGLKEIRAILADLGLYKHKTGTVTLENGKRVHLGRASDPYDPDPATAFAVAETPFVSSLAQTVQPHIPEAVSVDPETGLLGLTTTPVFWAGMNAIAQVDDRLAALEAKLDALLKK